MKKDSGRNVGAMKIKRIEPIAVLVHPVEPGSCRIGSSARQVGDHVVKRGEVFVEFLALAPLVELMRRYPTHG